MSITNYGNDLENDDSASLWNSDWSGMLIGIWGFAWIWFIIVNDDYPKKEEADGGWYRRDHYSDAQTKEVFAFGPKNNEESWTNIIIICSVLSVILIVVEAICGFIYFKKKNTAAKKIFASENPNIDA